MYLVFIYPAKQAPHYKIGYKAALGFCVASMAFTGVFRYLAQREKAKLRSVADRPTREEELPRVEDIEEK